MLDWGLLRSFVAVGRGGSLAAAARQLKVDQTTIGRHVTALEAQLGVQLFRRTAAGYRPTPTAEQILHSALAAEEAITEVERRLVGHDMRLEGRVTVTATDVLATQILDSLGDFRGRHPCVELELLVDNRRYDLSRGDADVAVRMAKPREPLVVARKIAALAFALYASESYLARRGQVKPGKLAGHDVLRVTDEIKIASDPWATAAIKGGTVVGRSNNLLSLTSAVSASLAVAVLPCILGDADRRLVRLGPAQPLAEVWLAMHRDLRKNARVRAVFDHLASFLDSLRPALLGRV